MSLARRGALAILVWLAVVTAGCGSPAPPVTPDDAFATFEEAIAGEGLLVCDQTSYPAGIANQSLESRAYSIAADCSQDPGSEVVVDRYPTSADRDAAADQFEISSRPRGSGAVWAFDDVTVFAHGQTDQEVMRRLTAAMDAAEGA